VRYDVDIVSVPAQPVLALRWEGPLAQIGAAMRRLRELAAEAGLETTGPMMARFYQDASGQDAGHDVAIAVLPTKDGSVPDVAGEARGEWLPLHHALEAVHYGPHGRMEDAWAAVREACTALGYTPSGPVTEVYDVTRVDGRAPCRRSARPCAGFGNWRLKPASRRPAR
jgi:effector-binding domain-containing protein